jgi:hypothetical protein
MSETKTFVFKPNADQGGTDVRFVDVNGKDLDGYPRAKSFGWSTRLQSDVGFSNESIDVISVGTADIAVNLGTSLSAVIPKGASSSGLSSDVAVLFVDANGLQKREEFKFGLVTDCKNGDPFPTAQLILFSDSDFRFSNDAALKARAQSLIGDSTGKCSS